MSLNACFNVITELSFTCFLTFSLLEVSNEFGNKRFFENLKLELLSLVGGNCLSGG